MQFQRVTVNSSVRYPCQKTRRPLKVIASPRSLAQGQHPDRASNFGGPGWSIAFRRRLDAQPHSQHFLYAVLAQINADCITVAEH